MTSQDNPDRIDISERVFAVRIRHQYFMKFPFDRDAVELMRMQSGAHYGGGAWCMPAHRLDEVHGALEKVNDILRENGVDTGPDGADAKKYHEEMPYTEMEPEF